jgi:HEAT repeat protein
LAVIDAAANIGLPESVALLEKLLYSDDDDIVDAAHEALGQLEEGEFD